MCFEGSDGLMVAVKGGVRTPAFCTLVATTKKKNLAGIAAAAQATSSSVIFNRSRLQQEKCNYNHLLALRQPLQLERSGDGSREWKVNGYAICLTLHLKLLDEPLEQELIFSWKILFLSDIKQTRQRIRRHPHSAFVGCFFLYKLQRPNKV